MTTTTEIDQLRKEVADVRAELARRDLEQISVENAIEFLNTQQRTLRYVLSGVARAFGTFAGVDQLRTMLYPEPLAGMPNHQAPEMAFDRPARRWTQFGTKAELIEKAVAAGVRSPRRSSREWLVRDLWAKRALPGSVALHRKVADSEAVAS